MKGLKFLLFAVVLMMAAGTLMAADTAFSGYAWLRYNWTNYVADIGTDKSQVNAFSVPRCYITAKTKINDYFSGNVTLEISNSDSAQSYVTTSPGNTVASNVVVSDWRAFLKNASFDIVNIIPDAAIRVGIQKVYFCTLDKWEYPIIEKEITDLAGLISSADFGIAVDGNIPGGWGEYQAGVYNGDGYARTEKNASKAVALSGMIVPFPGIYFRASYYGDCEGNTSVSKMRAGGVLGFGYGPVSGHVEYVYPVSNFQKDPNNQTMGRAYEVFVMSKIPGFEQMSVAFRYDYYKADILKEGANAGSKDAIWLIGGVNYALANNLLLQFNIEGKDYEKPTLNNEVQYIVQTKLMW